jgi:hypothetical protein
MSSSDDDNDVPSASVSAQNAIITLIDSRSFIAR